MTFLLQVFVLTIAVYSVIWAFDDPTLCSQLEELAEGNSEQVINDPMVQDDGITVICSAKTVTFNKTLIVPATEFKEDWRSVLKNQINLLYCKDLPYAEAIQNGWKFNVAVTTADREFEIFEVGCELTDL